MKQRFKDTTYSLAKSLHHINIAREYLHDVRRDSEGSIKNVFNQCVLKCDWIIANFSDRLSDSSKKILKQELADSFLIEAINDKLIHLNNQQRTEVESFIEKLIKP